MGEGEVEIGRGEGRRGRAGATAAQLTLHLVAGPRREIPLRPEAAGGGGEDRGAADRLEGGVDVTGELGGGGDRRGRLRRHPGRRAQWEDRDQAARARGGKAGVRPADRQPDTYRPRILRN